MVSPKIRISGKNLVLIIFSTLKIWFARDAETPLGIEGANTRDDYFRKMIGELLVIHVISGSHDGPRELSRFSRNYVKSQSVITEVKISQHYTYVPHFDGLIAGILEPSREVHFCGSA